MKLLLILASLFIYSLAATAKDHTIKLKVRDLPSSEIIVTRSEGDNITPVDTLQSENGTIAYTFPKDLAPGMYAMTIHKVPIWQFIYNNENIVAETQLGAPNESVKIIESNENIAYYSFIRKQNQLISQLEIVQTVINEYPVSEQFYSQAVEEYEYLYQKLDSTYTHAVKGTKNLLAQTYISGAKEFFMPLDIAPNMQNKYAKLHYFDQIPWQDTMLIYSDILPKKLLQYFKYFSPNGQGSQEASNAYIAGADSILTKVLPYPRMYDFVANYLLDGFEGIGQEAVADFIAEQYAQINSCEKKDDMSTIETKVYNRVKLRPGNDAPHFELSDDSGTFSYNGSNEKPIVLVFWATWCGHCIETMPQMHRYLGSFVKLGVDVITVSLDKDKEAWAEFVKFNNLESFKNFCPGNSWDSKIAENYAVYATPSFYVIKNGKISSKPLTLDQVPAGLK